MSGLALENVTIRAGGQTLLAAFDLTVAPGEIVTLMGPSGAGKSSLLAWIAGTLPLGVDGHGRLTLDGHQLDHLPPEERRLGLLLQEPLLFPHMTVAGNLVFAIPRHVKGRTRRHAKAQAALAEVGLEGLGGRDPHTLSGGQKSRAALARCLLAEPRALLLDEPFVSLDSDLRQEIRSFVLDRARATGLPVLLVTHDQGDAEAAAGRIVEPWAQPWTPTRS
jgi:putative thiamine transport system ATP-binding protein